MDQLGRADLAWIGRLVLGRGGGRWRKDRQEVGSGRRKRKLAGKWNLVGGGTAEEDQLEMGAPRGAVEGTKPVKSFLAYDENSSSGLGFVLFLGSFRNNTLPTQKIQSDFAWCLTRPKDKLTQKSKPII